MTKCLACSAEILGQDRFCRNCGTQVVTSVADLVDTYPINPTLSQAASARANSPEPTNPIYAPPQAAYYVAQGSAPLLQTAPVKKSFWRKFLKVMAFLLLLGIIAGGIGAGIEAIRDRRASRIDNVRRAFNEDIQNKLGFKPSGVTGGEFPGIRGIFINSLMSDDSPAAVANIQAGDVLMELNNQVVRNSSELAQVLNSLSPDDEVPVKVYRDGEIVVTRIKIADPAIAPFQSGMNSRNQGFLGMGDGQRTRIPGTKKWGVEIDSISDNGPAYLFGLQAGDIITEFDGHPIRTRDELYRRIRAGRPRSKILVKFYRGNTEQTVEIILGHQ
ncbi:MAG: PDZ domain-containing protein [Acidobacteria bacterium]|nr:PDZ domain-containing protein [Acidobacteriota bacterium]